MVDGKIKFKKIWVIIYGLLKPVKIKKGQKMKTTKKIINLIIKFDKEWPSQSLEEN